MISPGQDYLSRASPLHLARPRVISRMNEDRSMNGESGEERRVRKYRGVVFDLRSNCSGTKDRDRDRGH